MKTKQVMVNDLTIGNPLAKILTFAIPIFIGNIFQQLYNVVDMVVVGHILGEEALASLGATTAIYGLVLGLANGMTNGFSIIIARYFGAKKYDTLKQTVAITMVLTLIISVLLTTISLIWLKPLLHALKTPEEVMGGAVAYISIILSTILVTMSYNMFAGILRAIGNSRMPLYFLMVATSVNIVLDILFIRYLNMGIQGAATATVLAQFSAVVLCILYIMKKCPIIRVSKKDFKYQGKIVSDLLTMGSSMAMMFSIVSVGTVALQSGVNSFGTFTVTAHTAARKLSEIFMLPLGTLSISASTFASQNFGAKQWKRIVEGIKSAGLLAVIWCVFANILIFGFAKQIITLMTGSDLPEVISTAEAYLRFNLPFYFVLCILLILRSTLQGIGRKVVPLIASTVELATKFLVTAILVPRLGYFGIIISEPVIWTICALLVLLDFVYAMKKLTQIGKESEDFNETLSEN